LDEVKAPDTEGLNIGDALEKIMSMDCNIDEIYLVAFALPD
jgi:hypothetical protein